jgi:DNA-binding MarR family transcriptional regulator
LTACWRPSPIPIAGAWWNCYENGRAAPAMAAAVGLNPPALSRHLRTLRASGLIEESHPGFDARVRIYTLQPKPMQHLKSWLLDTERLWSSQLTAFKAHLERVR